MATLSYLDPNTGDFVEVQISADVTDVPNEVAIGTATPTDPDVELWVDTNVPASVKAKVGQAWVRIAGGSFFWSGTRAEYDAIATKDPEVLYVIEEASGSTWMTIGQADARYQTTAQADAKYQKIIAGTYSDGTTMTVAQKMLAGYAADGAVVTFPPGFFKRVPHVIYGLIAFHNPNEMWSAGIWNQSVNGFNVQIFKGGVANGSGAISWIAVGE